jgi:hypothetical protein
MESRAGTILGLNKSNYPPQCRLLPPAHRSLHHAPPLLLLLSPTTTTQLLWPRQLLQPPQPAQCSGRLPTGNQAVTDTIILLRTIIRTIIITHLLTLIPAADGTKAETGTKADEAVGIPGAADSIPGEVEDLHTGLRLVVAPAIVHLLVVAMEATGLLRGFIRTRGRRVVVRGAGIIDSREVGNLMTGVLERLGTAECGSSKK